MCDWESSENQTAIREHVGLLSRGCSCSSATACSTRRCSCVKKGSRCGPGCRCKNCSNSINTVASIPGTQQHIPVELHEIEQEKLLHDELLRMGYGEEVVVEGNLMKRTTIWRKTVMKVKTKKSPTVLTLDYCISIVLYCSFSHFSCLPISFLYLAYCHALAITLVSATSYSSLFCLYYRR